MMIGVSGAAIDFFKFSSMRGSYQEIADTAALSGARQFSLLDPGEVSSLPETIAKQVAERMLAGQSDGQGATVTATANFQNATIDLLITKTYQASFVTSMFQQSMTVDVGAVAQAAGAARVCILATNTIKNRALSVGDSAKITGNECAFFSNSDHENAIFVAPNTEMRASMICSSGGQLAQGIVDPAIDTECPRRDDPVADYLYPNTWLSGGAGCTGPEEVNLSPPEPGSVGPAVEPSIEPGRYCSGLKISGSGTVMMEPGVYVIQDHGLQVTDEISLIGFGVTLFFPDPKSNLLFDRDTEIIMSAPEFGETAGILVFQHREANENTEYTIRSDNARKLVGTIYVPQGSVVVDASTRVAQDSAYTAIVANRIEVKGTAELVLNSDYAATDVPVPNGLAGGRALRLLR